MIKKIVLILLLFVSLVYSQQVFKSDTFSFEITFPNGWDVKEGTTTLLAVIANSGNFNNINIVVKENESIGKVGVDDIDIDKFKDELVSNYKEVFSNFKTIDYGKTTINSINTLYFIYNCDIADQTLRAKQYFLFNNTKMYVISTGCLDSETSVYESVYSDCMNSFKFIN